MVVILMAEEVLQVVAAVEVEVPREDLEEVVAGASYQESCYRRCRWKGLEPRACCKPPFGRSLN